jgi:DNA-directed RNA polymerase subunit RPC12/RpoP
MTRKTRTIECADCSFEGSLTYTEGDFGPSDISYCPACGSDISEDYNVAEDEEGED